MAPGQQDGQKYRKPRSLLAALGLLLVPVALLSAPVATAKKPDVSDPKQAKYQGPMAATQPGRFTTQANTAFNQTGNFTVDVNNRQHVQAFFNSVYTASENTPLTFTGSVAGCASGTTPNLFKDAIRLRINWFRELAGVTDNISFNNTFNEGAQDAALIMAANGLLTHTPPNSLDCYTSTGDTGAGSSNLALGSLGWSSITGYMEDAGANNAAVGHRRWLLHPPTLEMGTGDVPATASSSATNAIWVFDDNIFSEGATRDGFVAWPPPAFIPHTVVPARWSFSLDDANFANATVSMTRDGSAISTTLEPVSQGAGLNTLVWIPLGLDAAGGEPWPQPSEDETLSVTLNNVVIDGTPQSFSYDVQIFDATTTGDADQITTITGPATGILNTTARFDFNQVDFAAGYRFRSGSLTSFSEVEGAEQTAEFITDATDSAYPLFTTDDAANGSFSLHLAHSIPNAQHFVWERQIMLSGTSRLNFASRLGFASVTQVARVQISLDDGQSWRDVYSQTGTDGRGETEFTNRSIALSNYAGKVATFRFFYDLLGGSYFPQTSAGVGFYVDDITVTNAQELTNIESEYLSNVEAFSYTPETAGDHLVQVQYLGWEGFSGSAWGPAKTLNVGAGPSSSTAIAASVLPASRSVFNTTATAFASVINAGSDTATNCSIAPRLNAPTNFTYQTTNPATNALTGTPNTPIDIAPGAVQTFALFMDPTNAFAPTQVALSFDCANTSPATIINGLNTLLVSSGAAPVPDIIALAAAGPTGIVDIPGNNATGVFAVATVNAGVASSISVSATGAAGVTVQLCETNPATGACISAVGSSVSTTIAAGATPTFGFFVTGNGNVPFDPANNRVSVTFTDGTGVTRGSTSVAIRTAP